MLSKFKIRFWIQLAFFLLISFTAINHNLTEAGMEIPLIGSASIHALCPFGAVVSFYSLLTTGTLVNKIHESAMVLFGITLFLAVLLGPVFCGWICPLGTIQEWVTKLGKRLKLANKWQIPTNLDKKLRYIRYVVLGWVIYVTATSGVILFADYDPYYALFNFWSGEVAISALVILLITLIGSLFTDRIWCKYACPFGGLLGLTNKFRIIKLKRNPSTCIQCNQCDKACPMGIHVSDLNTIKSTSCISCLNCTSENVCPIPKTVTLTVGRDQ